MSEVPEEIIGFVVRYIDSIAQLEALLLVLRRPDEPWTVGTIAARLYISEADAGVVLDSLCSDGLLNVENGVYRFALQNEKQKALVERVEKFYAKHLIPVTNLIHSKPRRLREFSDAFKFRKDRQ